MNDVQSKLLSLLIFCICNYLLFSSLNFTRWYLSLSEQIVLNKFFHLHVGRWNLFKALPKADLISRIDIHKIYSFISHKKYICFSHTDKIHSHKKNFIASSIDYA